MKRTWLLRRPVQPLRPLRLVAALTACAGFVALAACSSPSSRFYTLGSDATTAATPTTTAARAPLLIEVPPVDVPSQVAKTSFVVQTGPNQVDVLEQTRWASMPGDEIRRALSVDLTQRLNTIDVSGTPYPDGVPVYRVSVNVQRFESWPGSHALIDAVWSVRAVRTQAVLTCRSVVSEPVASGYDALVDGHRRAVQDISAQIAAGIGALAAAPQPRVAVPAKNASAAAAAHPVTVPCPVMTAAGTADASTGH
ncbi:PqiC family protein [Paraburkholderia flava]|uniref:PqiC family protein n=1 Tax=Paraburkholderia flava TaxID=2547393 RepID=UPI00106013F2|nr:PqiC family protein [Paraburkholderia flava]